jgi:hypothetical protein
MEYILILSASILIIIIVVLISRGLIGNAGNAAGNQVGGYNSLVNRFKYTPTPPPAFPCPYNCTVGAAGDAFCVSSCGAAFRCAAQGYCDYR